MDESLTQTINGKKVFKRIQCHATHDPDAPLDVVDTCGTWIYLGPGLWIDFSLHQQYMPLIPALHNKLLQTLEASRKQ
jgi:hypothetical protein